MIVAYRWLVRSVERRRPDELGIPRAAGWLALGATAGAGLFGVVYVLLGALGAVAFEGFGGVSGLGVALAVAIASAVGEEIVFRGVLFRLLEERLGTTIALNLSAVAFGFVHAGNRGATWVSTLAIVLESGALMGLGYVATRTLWLPIGLHFGWNFTEGGIFGAAVSGGQYTGLVVGPLSGPPFITGGAFGPEASIAAVAVSLGASAALAWFAISTGAWRRWRRAFATR
jgi:membrane protease YdiL (CAAX protease family)